MENLKILPLLVFSFLFLASCEKPESEENKPEEPVQTVTAEPRIDLIRKVIRYNTSGGIEDSVLFQYDSQSRVSIIEYGPYVNGNFHGRITYSYTRNQTGRNIVLEKNYVLNNSGQYDSILFVTYNIDTKSTLAGSIQVASNPSFQGQRTFQVICDSQSYIKAVIQTGIKKQTDYYLDYNFRVHGGNIIEALADSYPGAGGDCKYEYYLQPYNHDLFISVLGMPHLHFWGTDLENVFDNRHRFLGKRNQNLVRKAVRGNTVELFDYEFNSLGLVSKIKTSITPFSGSSTPMQTKYALFYY